MIKPKKDKNPITAVSSQMNQDRYQHLTQNRNSPLYHYNMYIRKEGQPYLNEEQYKEYCKRALSRIDFRTTKKEVEIINTDNETTPTINE